MDESFNTKNEVQLFCWNYRIPYFYKKKLNSLSLFLKASNASLPRKPSKPGAKEALRTKGRWSEHTGALNFTFIREISLKSRV